MTFQEAVDLARKISPPGGDWYESHIRLLAALGAIKLDDEYDQAIRDIETMDNLCQKRNV